MPSFKWDDPFFLDDQLTEEEVLIRDTARDYAQEKLQTRVKQAYRDEFFHREIMTEMGAEDTCHSFRETGPWILLTVTSAGCPFVQLGVPLATADVCRAKPGGCEACSRGLGK